MGRPCLDGGRHPLRRPTGGGGHVQAAQIAAQAQHQAAVAQAQAAERQAQAIRQGNQLAQQRFETVQQQAQPAVEGLQRIASSDPYALTPQQEQEIADSRRTAMNALAVSGLRGSGRATVDAVRGSEDATRGRIVARNQARSDTATTGLAGQYFTAVGKAAGLDASTGEAVGKAVGKAYDPTKMGELNANALLATTTLQGRALGDVAAVTADALKEGRRSYYRDNRPSERDDKTTLGG